MAELPLFDDSEVHNVLCVVAHPDDMEYGASAAVARWTGRGARVTYLLLTAGEAGIRDQEPSVVGPLRKAEQARACEAVGVADLRFLDLPDGTLEHTLDTRKRIARVMREVKPDTLVTSNWDAIAPWGPNQADHRVAGLATLDAARDADNPWVFPELLADEGLEPWGADRLIVTGVVPQQAIELSDENLEAAVASLECHRQYLAALGDHPAPREMITEMTKGAGEAAGVEYALGVTVHPL